MKSVIIKVNDTVQTIAEHQVITKDGQPTVIKAVNRVNYELIDQATGRAPDHIVTKRVGKDLHISIEKGNESDLIIEGYYNEVDSALIGLAEDGSYYYYIPDTGEVADFVTELAPGDIEGQALGGNAQPTPWWVGATDEGFVWLPWLVGLAGLGAIAALAGNDDDADNTDTTAPTKPATPVVSDDVGDVKGPLADGDTTDDSQPNVAVPPLADGDEVVLIVDGESVPFIENADGTISPETPLGEGDHTIQVAIKDEAGNQSEPSDPITIAVDTTAPTKPATPVVSDDVGDVQGPLADGDTTDDTQPNVAVPPLADGDEVVLIVDGESVPFIENADGTISPETPLGEGDHTIQVAIKDEAGNQSESSDPITIAVDTTAPTKPATPVVSDDVGDVKGPLADGDTTDDSQPNVAVPPLADGDEVVLIVDGESVPFIENADGTISPETPLGEGDHTIQVAIKDEAGNQSEPSDPITIAVDTSVPTQTTEITIIRDDVAPQTGSVANDGSTNDVAPTIEGTISSVLNDGEVVSVYRNGVKVGKADVTNTTWRLEDTGLTDGESYTYTAQVEDAAGNKGSESNSYVITVDTTAPTQSVAITSIEDDVVPQEGMVANGGQTNDTTPLIEGTLSADLETGEKVVVLRDGEVIGTATVSGTDWSYEDSGLADGESYIYTARVEDSAGNRGAISGNYNITVDTSVPTQTTEITIIRDDVAPQTGSVANDGSTNDVAPTIEGTISSVLNDGEVVSVYRNGVKVGKADVTNTTWRLEDTGLTDGESYTYTAQVEDAAGNKGSESNSYVITVDTTAPTQSVAITSIEDDVVPQEGMVANGGQTNDTTPLIEGTLSADLETGEKVVVLRDGEVIGTATVSGTDWSYEDSGLADGESYIYTARVEDSAGNRGAISGNYNITVDTSVPTQTTEITIIRDDVAPQTGSVANDGSTNDVAPTIEGTISSVLNDEEVVSVYRNGVKVGTADVTNTTWRLEDTGLTDGESYTYTAQVEDAAGNEGSESNSYVITVDTTAPTQSVAITNIEDDVVPQEGMVANGGQTNDTTPLIEGTLSADLENGEKVVVLRDGEVIGTATVSGTDWSYEDSGLADGESYIYTARVEDSAGNRGAISGNYSITVDTSVPTQTTEITIIRDDVAPQTGDVISGDTTDDTTPLLQGNISQVLSDNEVVVIYRDGVKVGTADVTNTIWSFEDSGLASDSEYIYTARVEDVAGNQGEISNDYAINVDTNGPTQSVAITSIEDDVVPQEGMIANGGQTNDTAPLIEGTLSADLETGEKVVVLRDGAVIGTATVSGTDWSYEDSGLTDGESYIYTVRVEDSAGIPGGISNSYSIEVDTTAPTQSTVITKVVDDVTPGLGDVANGAFTNDDTPEIQGTISDVLANGEVVAVYRDGVKVGNATVTGTDWSYTDASLASGEAYDYTARVEDGAGNQGDESNNYSISIDTSGSNQSVQILSVIDDFVPQTGVVANGDSTNDITPQITGSISTALTGTETVVVLRDGIVLGNATVNGTTWAYDDSDLEDGNTYEYTARVDTAGGNQSPESQAYTIEVDTTAPTQSTVITKVVDDVTPGLGDVANGAFTNDDTPEIQGTISDVLANGEVVTVYRDGVKVGNATVTGTDWSYTDASLASGEAYDYTARVEDGAGNQGDESNNYSISIDTSGSSQSVQILSVIDDFVPQTGVVANGDSTNDITPQITGSISTALTGTETVVVLRDGIVLGNATVNGTTWAYDDSDLEDGNTYEYTARVDTAGGNQSPESQAYTIEVDTTAPTQSTVITKVVDDVTPGLGDVANGAFTNDDTPEIQGTISDVLANGEVVAVYRDGVKVGNATVTGTDWSYTDASLASGEAYDYTARVEDGAGNQGDESNNYSISIDTSGSNQSVQILSVIDDFVPQTGVVANGDSTNDITPQITGSISTALTGTETVVVLRDGIVLGNATVNGTTWAYDDSDLEDGNTYEYTARVDTAGGNQSPTSQAYSISVDTTVPATNTINIASISDDTGVADDFITKDTTLTFNGTLASALPADEKVQISLDGGTTWKDATTTGTDWAYDNTGNTMTEGDYTVKARIVDTSGNEGATATQVIKIDTTVPATNTINIASISDDTGVADDFITKDTTLTFNGTLASALPADEKVQISLDGGTTWKDATTTGTDWAYDNTGNTMTEGDYTVKARIVDIAGNEGATATQVVKIDTTVPATNTINIASISDDTGVADDFITKDTTLTFNGTLASALPADEKVQISLDGGTTWKDATTTGTDWAYDNTGNTMTEGDYTVKARIVDIAGNEGATATQVVKIDTTVPATNTINIASISDDTGVADDFITKDTTLTFNGTLASALPADEKVQISLDGGTTWKDATTTGTDWAYDNTGNAMTEGDYTVKARIVDTAGNEGATATQVIKIDTTVPATTPTVDADLATPAFDVLYTTSTSPVITGTVSEALISGETLEVTIGGATYIVTPEADNSWSLDTSTASPKAASPAFIPLASGDNSVVAKVLDTAGNASTDVTSDEVVVLAKVKELTLSDDLTDFDANGDELSNTTTPTGSATVINGVQSTDYGAAYLYEGNVAQALDIGTPVAPLEGLTNDNTPTVIIKLDKEIAINYQELQVIRSYKDEEGNWIDEGVIASTSGSGISLTGSGPDFSFDDTLSDGEPDKEYRYEAKVDNIPAIADSNLETSESVEFELDTVATVPIITGFDTTNNTISGISTENGTIFVNYNNEKSKVIVTEGAEWTLQLTTSQMNAFLDVNDPDNYDVNSNSSAEPTAAELTAMQAETEVFDEFLPIDFVDKAGNVTPVANEIYYFDSSDGPNGVLNPEDNPETATTSFSPGQPDPIPTTTINGDVYQIYTTTFSDASQTVYVDGNIDNYNGADDIFNLDLAGGNDTLKLNGNIENGVNIFMGAGDDTVIAEKLDGQSANNPTVIDMGDGNNTVTKTAEGNFNYIQVIAGDGDDVFEMKLPNSDLKNSSLLLGGGNNYINSGDDFDNVTVITGDGDDTIFVESPVNENNCDISGVYDLGDGNNKIVLTSGGINNWYTESGTTITMGAGDDIVDIAKDFDNSNQGNKVTSMSTGAGIDKITIGEDINGDTVSIYLNDGDDELTVRNIEGGSLVDTGLGIDTVVITGSIQGVGTAVDLGDGGDFITISDNILASTNTNLGAGNDTFTLTGYIDGNVDAGAGNDILNFNGNIRAGATVDGGDGTDTINITNSNSNSNISLSNILNVEIINLNNSDRNLNNVNIDNLTNDLYMKGGADDTVNIGRQSGLTEPYRFEDTAGGVWTKGGTEVDANDGSITYNVWSNASSTHSVYIQDTITDVI